MSKVETLQAWLGVGGIYLQIAETFDFRHCYPFTEFERLLPQSFPYGDPIESRALPVELLAH